jgi:O-antigen/teichoic acid export membrane protein
MTSVTGKASLWRLHRRNLSWGMVDQLFSSATNFGLSLLAGRLLGPSGLGVVLIGYFAYLACLSLLRALVSDPLVALAAPLSTAARQRAVRFGLTTSMVEGTIAAAALAVAGAAIPGRIGTGLLLFAPWMLPLLVQDYWRAVLFMEHRGRAATANDGIWLVAMAVAAPLLSLVGSEWAVIASWAGGATAGAVLGFVQMRIRPAAPLASMRWWRAELWPLGRWLSANAVLYSLMNYATVVALVALLGTRRFGGLQAAITLFGPLSLVSNAISFPGLPAVSRALATSRASARNLAGLIGVVAAALIAAYVAGLSILSVSGTGALPLLFGSSFKHFSNLVWPVATGQLLTGAALGFALLLTAQKRGRAILGYGAVTWLGSFVLASTLAWTSGVVGAAWGLAGGLALGAVTKTALALRGVESRPSAPDVVRDVQPLAVPARPPTG